MIQVGEKLPAIRLHEGNPGNQVDMAELFKGKKGVVFAVPGAFTPGCSKTHLPGYVANFDAISAKGVDVVACVSVNDAFVMGAWGKDQNADEILMLADGNGDFTSELGLELDGTGFGMGKRSQRFAMIVEDGKVTHLNVEPGPGIEVSSAEVMMELL